MTQSKKNQDIPSKARQVRDEATTEAQSVAETVTTQASDVKDSAVDATQQVVGQAKQEATQVAAEARDQVRSLLDTTLGEVRGRAAEGQGAIASTVRSLSQELSQLTTDSSANGPVAQMAGDLARRGEDAAAWLENRQPDDVLLEVRRYAARKPGTFMALAAGAGLLVGRLARGQQQLVQDEKEAEERRQAARFGADHAWTQQDRTRFQDPQYYQTPELQQPYQYQQPYGFQQPAGHTEPPEGYTLPPADYAATNDPRVQGERFGDAR